VWNLVSHNRTETDWGRHNTGWWGRYLDVRERKYQETGENRTFRSFMTGTPLRMWPNYWAWDEAHVAPTVQKLKVWRGAHRSTDVKWFPHKVRIGFKCLRTATSGGPFFRTQYGTFRLNKMCERFARDRTLPLATNDILSAMIFCNRDWGVFCEKGMNVLTSWEHFKLQRTVSHDNAPLRQMQHQSWW